MRTEIPEICLIAPTEELMKKSDKIIRKYKKKVHVYQGSIGNAIELSERLLNQGAQVIISRRGTKKIIEKKFPDQVIDIGLTLADYMPVIEEAAAISGKTAFFSYGKIREDVKVICHMLKIEAEFYSFTNLSDCYHIVEEAVKGGAQLGIGGADTEKIAHDKGLRHLVVENSEESLLRAIEMAEQLLQVKKKEKEKQKQLKLKMERYQLIFNHTHDAIIAVNREGEIDVINDEAKKILKRGTQNLKETEMVEKEAVQDTRLMEVFHTGEKKLNQLMSLNGVLVSANRMPIVVDGKIEGVIATFQDVKAIQDNEQRIRVKLHQRGLIAKYHFTDIIGESKLMRDNVNLAKKFAKSDATILLQGETGTGKELFAQSIHNASRRAEGPFVAVNCGAFPRICWKQNCSDMLKAPLQEQVRGEKSVFLRWLIEGQFFWMKLVRCR